jgi:hypothetical protein
VTGQLFDDLWVLQACRAYEEAAGLTWPSPELTGRLASIAGSADADVTAKRWSKRQ